MFSLIPYCIYKESYIVVDMSELNDFNNSRDKALKRGERERSRETQRQRPRVPLYVVAYTFNYSIYKVNAMYFCEFEDNLAHIVSSKNS